MYYSKNYTYLYKTKFFKLKYKINILTTEEIMNDKTFMFVNFKTINVFAFGYCPIEKYFDSLSADVNITGILHFIK